MQMQTKSNNRIPGPGDSLNLFERLSSYISKIDPDWINRIKPARQESIDLLRKLSGLEDIGLDFPETYKIFLKFMGQSDGELLESILQGDLDIETVIEYYEGIREDESPDIFNPKCLAFALTYFGGQIAFDLRQPDNPNIVNADDGKISGFFSESFEKLLFQYSFLKYEKMYYPEVIYFGGSQAMLESALARQQITDVFEVVDCYSKNKGFQKVWFSDQRHYIGVRDDATFFISKDTNVAGIITGYNRKYLEDIVNSLTPDIGTKIQSNAN